MKIKFIFIVALFLKAQLMFAQSQETSSNPVQDDAVPVKKSSYLEGTEPSIIRELLPTSEREKDDKAIISNKLNPFETIQAEVLSRTTKREAQLVEPNLKIEKGSETPFLNLNNNGDLSSKSISTKTFEKESNTAFERKQNNGFRRTTTNVMFTGRYIMRQLKSAGDTPAGNFSTGYLFSEDGTNFITVEYVDETSRRGSLSYLPEFFPATRFYQWNMDMGSVVFDEDQFTVAECQDGKVILGPADESGIFSPDNDTEFTLTLKENVDLVCGSGAEDISFTLTKALDHDMALSSLISPTEDAISGPIPVTIKLTNFGNTVEEGFEVSFSLDNEEMARETINMTLEPEMVLEYTFENELEFPAAGTYEVQVDVHLPSDGDTQNNAISKTVNVTEINGFEGPYMLEQLERTFGAPSAAFANGYLFDRSGMTPIYIKNEGQDKRSFEAIYLPVFNDERVSYTFRLVDDQVIFGNEQPTGINCTGNEADIALGVSSTPGTFDINDPSEFTLNLREDLHSSCNQGVQDVSFRLVKVDAFEDLAVVDITNPSDIFPASDQNVQVSVQNLGNVLVGSFDVVYFINNEEVGTVTWEGELNVNETVPVVLPDPIDFSIPGEYTIRAEVRPETDEPEDNNTFEKTVVSLAPITQYPYDQSFDDPSKQFPVGWEVNDGWQIDDRSLYNSTGPRADNTTGDGFYMFADVVPSETASIVMRRFDLTGLEAPVLSFYYHMFGAFNYDLRVKVNDDIVFSILGQQQSSAEDPFTQARINLSELAGQQVDITFLVEYRGAGSLRQVVAIDDIVLQETPKHDLVLNTIVSPVNVVEGERFTTITVTNSGRRAESEFELAYYVNGQEVSSELFAGIIKPGESVNYKFQTPYNFDAVGDYDIKTEVKLPTDVVRNNDVFQRTVRNLDDRPFTGLYRLNQNEKTTSGPSSSLGNGYLFGAKSSNLVDLKFVSSDTRQVSLIYLEENITVVQDYLFKLNDGETFFVDDQSTDVSCQQGDVVLLGTADTPGLYNPEDDRNFSLLIKEDVENHCDFGTNDVQFTLNKVESTVEFEYDLSVVDITLPDTHIPLSRQRISFRAQNLGLAPQGEFEAAYFIDDQHISTQTFLEENVLNFNSTGTFVFDEPFYFAELKSYDVRVELTAVSDDNPQNNQYDRTISTIAYNINAIPIPNGQIGVEWSSVGQINSATLQRSNDGEEYVDLHSITPEANFHIEENPDPTLTYSYRIEATLAGGALNYSETVTVTADQSGDFMFHKVLGDITGVDTPNNSYASSWADLDNDGDIDMVVANVPGFADNLSILDQPTIYLNDGQGNFEKALDNSAVNQGTSSRSAALVDYNNDGQSDLFLSAFGSTKNDANNRVFRNNGNLDFTPLEIPTLTADRLQNSEESSWADMDNDGDLDLFIAGSFNQFFTDFLYENKGGGQFESIRSGVLYESLYNSNILSWGASWVDYDGDGDQDLFVPNDDTNNPGRLFRNDGANSWTEIKDKEFVQIPIAARGAHWSDLDQDGAVDLVMINRLTVPVFYFNDGSGNFSRIDGADAFGESVFVHRISTVGDINNNGLLDVIFSQQEFFVFECNRDRTFTKLENVLPTLNNGVFAGISLADMDGDGDLDLFKGNSLSPSKFNLLLENQGNSNNWLHIDLDGRFSNADGIGAKLELTIGDEVQFRNVTSSTGLSGQNSLLVEFGLGVHTVVDKLKITWQSGAIKELFNISANQLIEVDDSNAPSDLGLNNVTIPENLVEGSPVGVLFSVDQDKGDTFTYEIVSSGNNASGHANIYFVRDVHGSKTARYNSLDIDQSQVNDVEANTDASAFFIENGTLRASTALDFEQQSNYMVQVRSTDSFGNTFDKVISIDVQDVDEEIDNAIPTDITLTNTSISENQEDNVMIGVLSTDDTDEDDTHTYSLVVGDASAFSIDGDVLYANGTFNFEERAAYDIVIRTIDNGGKSLDKPYIISIEDVNEEPIDLNLDSTELKENVNIGTLVGNLTTEDTDDADAHTYTLTGEDAASFRIVDNRLLTATEIDFESKPSFDIVVQSTDQEGLNIEMAYTINVANENEAPSALAATNNSIDEGLSVGSEVTFLDVTDEDLNDIHTYSIEGPDQDKFKILLNEIRSNEEFDFEVRSEYSITVTVMDAEGASFSTDLTIEVVDKNDAPSEIRLSNANLPEGVPAGTTVGGLTTVDQDGNDQHAYTLSSDNDDADSFVLNGNLIQSTVELDFETQSSYSLLIRTIDQGGATLDETFTIDVLDIDESSPNAAPTDITISSTTIAENTTVGTTLALLSSVDPDENDNHSYSIIDDLSSLFVVNDNRLESTEVLDFETKDSHTISIRTTDTGGLIYDKTFTIIVEDVNEAPVSISFDNALIDENVSVGTVIGTLSTVDPDEGDTQSYSLSGDDADNFEIVGSEIRTAVDLDFESQSTYQVVVTSIDSQGLSINEEIVISVNDINDKPTAISLSALSVDEASAVGTVVGTLSTTDQDLEDTHIYTLSGEDAASFEIVANEVKTTETFNFEVKSSYNINIAAMDDGGLSTSSDFDILINDVNDLPTAVTLDNTSINEELPAGSTVGMLELQDEDTNDSQSFSVSGADAASFQISGNELQTAVKFDFERKTVLNVVVTGTDGSGASIDNDFVINVLNVNDAPENIVLTDNGPIDENATVGTQIGNITFDDDDQEDTHTITLSGADASNFEIVEGVLRTAINLDFEVKHQHDFTITVTDNGGLETTKDVVVMVNDVNEAPINLSITNNRLAEGLPVGSLVGNILFDDPDTNDAHTILLSGADAGSFEIVEGELLTSEMFDFETKSDFSVAVSVTDLGGLEVSETFQVVITDENEAPTNLILSNSSIDESQNTGILVGSISFDDQDLDDSHSILLSGSDASLFQIVGKELQTAEPLNFEAQSNYETTITVRDAGGLVVSENVVITVNDINEAPSDILLNNNEIAEQQPIATVIGSFTVEDEDSGDTHTFTISGVDAASFEIVNGELKSSEVFNFDMKDSYSITVEASDGSLSISKDFQIVITDVLGIEKDSPLVLIYPNPSDGIFTIALDPSFRGSEWNLYDIKGNIVKQRGEVIGSSNGTITIDFSFLSDGQYILEIVDADRRITKQVIVRK